MIKCGLAPRPATFGAKIQSFVCWSFCFVFAASVMVAAPAQPDAQNPDELYIRIMAVIDRADALAAAGKNDAARAKYLEAEKALLYFKATNPLFSPRAVAYRLKEVTEKADTRPQVPASMPSSESPKTNLEAPAAASKSGVKLLDAGAEPRTVLRYHPKAGDKQLAIMTLKTKVDLPTPPAGAGGAPAQNPQIPAITIPMDITVQSVGANGDITYESVMGDAGFKEEAGVQPDTVQQLKTELAGLKGATTVAVFSSRGVTKKLDIKAPATADPRSRQMMDQVKESMGNMAVPFPDEAVGAGAKWEFKKMSKVQSMSVEETGSYELTSLEGDRLATKYTVAVNAAGAATQNAAAARVTSTRTGTANIDLSKLIGPAVTMDAHTEAPVGQNGTMKMDMNVSIEAQ